MIDFILTLPAWAFGIGVSTVLFWLLSIGIVLYQVLTAKDAPEGQE
jgi:hypothetical protein